MSTRFTGSHALALAALLLGSSQASWAANVVDLEGVAYSVNAAFGENLKSFVGKRVSVTLESGTKMAGVVKAVGEHLLHLEKLDGKEYFDALIRIDRISAIDVRFRQLER